MPGLFLEAISGMADDGVHDDHEERDQVEQDEALLVSRRADERHHQKEEADHEPSPGDEKFEENKGVLRGQGGDEQPDEHHLKAPGDRVGFQRGIEPDAADAVDAEEQQETEKQGLSGQIQADTTDVQILEAEAQGNRGDEAQQEQVTPGEGEGDDPDNRGQGRHGIGLGRNGRPQQQGIRHCNGQGRALWAGAPRAGAAAPDRRGRPASAIS